jgi:hypothetical protein
MNCGNIGLNTVLFKLDLMRELSRRKKEEGRRKKEEGRRKKEEGRRKKALRLRSGYEESPSTTLRV